MPLVPDGTNGRIVSHCAVYSGLFEKIDGTYNCSITTIPCLECPVVIEYHRPSVPTARAFFGLHGSRMVMPGYNNPSGFVAAQGVIGYRIPSTSIEVWVDGSPTIQSGHVLCTRPVLDIEEVNVLTNTIFYGTNPLESWNVRNIVLQGLPAAVYDEAVSTRAPLDYARMSCFHVEPFTMLNNWQSRPFDLATVDATTANHCLSMDDGVQKDYVLNDGRRIVCSALCRTPMSRMTVVGTPTIPIHYRVCVVTELMLKPSSPMAAQGGFSSLDVDMLIALLLKGRVSSNATVLTREPKRHQ